MPVEPFGRPPPEVREAALRLVDAIGLHLVCPEARCRRARRCADPDRTQLPLCFWLHRGTCRFVLAATVRRRRLDAEADEAGAAGAASGPSLLGRLREAGWPVARLARGRADGADEWGWERVPAALALVGGPGAARPTPAPGSCGGP